MLQAMNLKKNYSSQLILNNASIHIKENEIHVIEGKSGSGKTTFLSAISGLEQPDSGSVLWKKNEFYLFDDKNQSRIRGIDMGYIFQDLHLLEELTAKQNILLPLAIKSREATSQLHMLSKRLGISALLDKKVFLLSGGEKQRIAIARALITEPVILFADEPTGQLDRETSKEFIELLLDIQQITKVALVIVTHEQRLISHPHNLYFMEKGELRKIKDVYDED